MEKESDFIKYFLIFNKNRTGLLWIKHPYPHLWIKFHSIKNDIIIYINTY